MKIATNLSLAVQMLAFSEGVLLAEKSGIPREVAVDVLTHSAVASPMIQYRGPFVLDMPDEAWFNVNMMQKDMLLAMELGRHVDVPLPMTASANEMLTAARGMGLAERDFRDSVSGAGAHVGPRKIDLLEALESKMAIKTYGSMAVDWENRINFDRLRKERLDKAKAELKKSEMGALLVFDMNNVRYLTATTIGTWAQDKISRFALLAPGEGKVPSRSCGISVPPPNIMSRACPWMGERSRAGISDAAAAPCRRKWAVQKM